MSRALCMTCTSNPNVIMLTGYCITRQRCDQCRRVTDLALTAERTAEPKPRVQSGWTSTTPSKPAPANRGTWPNATRQDATRQDDPSWREFLDITPEPTPQESADLDAWMRDSIDEFVRVQLAKEDETESFR